MININKTIQIKTCNKIPSGSTVSASLLTGGERAPGSGRTPQAWAGPPALPGPLTRSLLLLCKHTGFRVIESKSAYVFP